MNEVVLSLFVHKARGLLLETPFEDLEADSTSVARIAFRIAFVTCAMMSCAFRPERSASAPATTPNRSSGSPRIAVTAPTSKALPFVSWYIRYPRVTWSIHCPLLVLSWLDENDAQQFKRLVPDGSGHEVTTVTNGGRFFVDFHWTFNDVVPDLQGRTFKWTYMLSGFVAMAFLIGTITGLVVHKKIFRHFFTFRHNAKVEQTRWLDAHNVLGVLAWPFLFTIVLSGLMFYCYLYIPTGMQMAARYPAPPRVVVPGVAGPGTPAV